MPAPKLTVADYFQYPETMLPQELVYGIVRDAPAPAPAHQWAVGRFFLALTSHVEPRRLGRVWMSPIDVVLDRKRPLVVQPDLVFISTARLAMVSDRVWGAPDLVVEILSPYPRIGRLDERLAWFAEYGVLEAWLVHQAGRNVEVLRFAAGATAERTFSAENAQIRSAVMPDFRETPGAILGR
jgi:Uma2 family endonuclease